MLRRVRPGAAAAALALCLSHAALSTAPAQGAESVERSGKRCLGAKATKVGTSGDDVIRGTRRADVIVAGAGDDVIHGLKGNDRICAGEGNDTVYAGKGRNRVSGQKGDDLVLGGPSDDRIKGGAGVDVLLGSHGSDVIAGGPSIDLAAYLDAREGVRADLGAGTAVADGVDVLRGIEALAGSAHVDSLFGDDGVNAFFTTGEDAVDGGGGIDYALFTVAGGGVAVDLGAGTTSGGGTLRGIENVVGSPYDDVLVGDAGDNQLDGAEGADHGSGGGGNDLCVTESTAECQPPATGSSEVPPPPSGPPQGAGTAPRSTTPPAPPATPEGAARLQRASGGYSYCPMLSHYATIESPRDVPGFGFFAWRTFHPFTGDGPFSYGRWIYQSGGQVWEWQGSYWTYLGWEPVQLGGIYVGTGLVVEGWYWSEQDRYWYSLGGCTGQGSHFF